MSAAAALYASALVWDQTFPATPHCGTWPSHARMLQRMRACGYAAVSITVAYDPDDSMEAIRRIGRWRRFVAEHSDRYTLLASADDAERAKAAGKLALGFHFQGTTPFERDLGLVEVFHALGVRHALLAYNQRNHAGGGCHEASDAGLSRFGKALVREMQRAGILVDCSHTGRRTALDALEIASAPVIFSHSNAAALHAHRQSIDDDLARACAATGGVVGVNGIGIFLGNNDASTDALFRHVDHWAERLGARHVGVGLDAISDRAAMAASVAQDSSRWPPDQLYRLDTLAICPPEQLLALCERMRRAGYRNDDVRAILGGNWQRLARECWNGGAPTRAID